MTDCLRRGYVMTDRARLFATLLLTAALAATPARAEAQAPGYSEIIAPATGETLQGLVAIEGTADHPAFVRYDLAFAHDPNPSGTWFPLGDPVETRARQSTLGLWDTAGLSPGIYQLRLRVHLESGAILEDTVRSLRIGLPPPLQTPTIRPTVAGQVAAVATPSPTPRPTPPAASASPNPVEVAFTVGGATAAGLLIGLGIYLPLRRGLAAWAGSMRMRRVLRRDQRRRRSRDGR